MARLWIVVAALLSTVAGLGRAECICDLQPSALAARVTQLEDLVLLHTERLTQLIGYQKHIVGLLEWKETFQQPHPQDLEQPPKPAERAAEAAAAEPAERRLWNAALAEVRNETQQVRVQLEHVQKLAGQLGQSAADARKVQQTQALVRQMSLLLSNLNAQERLAQLESTVGVLQSKTLNDFWNELRRKRSGWNRLAADSADSVTLLDVLGGLAAAIP